MSPDPGRPFTVEPWLVREPTLDMDVARRRPSRSSRCPTATSGCAATSTRASRTPPPAPTSTRSTSCGRCRTPRAGTATRVRPDDHQRHQRQAHPPARRRRAVRPPLRRAAPPRAGARPAGGHAHPRGRVELARRASGAGAQRAAGVAHPAGDRGDPLRGRGPRRTRRCSWCSPSWWPTSSCPPATAATPASRRRSPTRWSSEQHRTRRRRRVRWSTTPGTPGCGWPPRWTTRSTGPRSTKITSEATRGHRPHHRDLPAGAGRRAAIVKYLAYGWSARRSLPALHDQVARRARRRPLHRLGRAAAPSSAPTSTTFWARADVEIDGDAELQQAVRFALFHVLQAGARAERRAIAAKGLTGPGYDGHTFWDTETFVPAGAHATLAPEAAARRAALAAVDPAAGPASAPQQLGLAGAAFPWRTIRGQECSGYWPAGTAAFHINADIADAVRRYLDATGDDRVRARGRPRAARRDRPAVALARATTTRRAASASTASPAPTSTARSPTTTSTPT